jgi:O-antigen ligase
MHNRCTPVPPHLDSPARRARVSRMNAAGGVSTASARPMSRPGWFDSLLFLVLMSGPPKLRTRDMNASLAGSVDSVVLLHLAIWACGGIWVFLHLYPAVTTRRVGRPSMIQLVAALFIGSLSLSVPRSPGAMLSGFLVGQFAVMFLFSAVFVQRFGTSSYFRHLFGSVCIFVLLVYATLAIEPELVLGGGTFRLRGDLFVGPGGLAVLGLVLCLSNTPALRSATFWTMTGLSGVLLAGAQTRTCYVAVAVYLVIGYVYGKGLRVRKLVPLLAVLIVCLSLMDALSPAGEYIVRDRATLETLSDRGPLWEFLIEQVWREAPLTGLGYFAASRVLAPIHNLSLGDAHSAFLEVVVGGGLIATALYLLLCTSLLLSALRLLWAAAGRPEPVAAAGLFFAMLILGFTSSSGLHPGPVGFTFWSTTALLPTLLRQSVLLRADATRHAHLQRRRTLHRTATQLVRS